jgi:hypothetical protein
MRLPDLMIPSEQIAKYLVTDFVNPTTRIYNRSLKKGSQNGRPKTDQEVDRRFVQA